MTGAFTVVSPCIIRGRPYKAGDTVTLDDVADINCLLTLGRIVAANSATEKRIRRVDVVQWGARRDELPPERDPWIRRA